MSHLLLDRPRGYNDLASIATIASPRIVEANLAIQLPSDYPHTTSSIDRAVLIADLPDSLAAKLRDFDPDHMDINGLPTFLLAAFTVFLARYTGEQSIRVSVPTLQVPHIIDLALPSS